jgi:hypothetical protein
MLLAMRKAYRMRFKVERAEDAQKMPDRFAQQEPSGLSKSFSQKGGCSGMLEHMNSVLEIEMALRQLPPQERWEIARWLLEDLQESNLSQTEGKGSGDNGGRTPPLPDYSARRRRIFGSKVLPNMVLVARAEERW